MAAPRSSSRCSLSLLTLFSISLILISVSLFVFTKPNNKPLIDYRNQLSVVSVSFPPSMSPLGQDNTTNTSFAPVSSPSPLLLPLLRERNTTNTTLSSVSHSLYDDQQNQNKSPSPTSKRVIIRKRSGLDKIESDLAKARAAIKKAASTQNYISSLYKNPAAFHQLSFTILLFYF